MNVPRPSVDILGTPRILFAAAPLIVPMTLRLSSLSLRAIVVLVVSRQKGITLVFKNDPLEAVQVSSSFDGVESVAGYIQREIEGQLREAFRSDLPGIIHRLSQKWLSGEVKNATGGKTKFAGDAKIKTKTAYVDGYGRRMKGRGMMSKMSNLSLAPESISVGSDYGETVNSMYSPSTARSSIRRSKSPAPPIRMISEEASQSVPDAIESYDPTYGLRPEAIPSHAGFSAYERVLRQGNSGRGLGDILGPEREDDEYEDDYRSDQHYDRSHYSFDLSEDRSRISGLETIPAVGGGTITRPRTFHTQSQIRPQSWCGNDAASGVFSPRRGDDASATGRRYAEMMGRNGNGNDRSRDGSGSSTPRHPALSRSESLPSQQRQRRTQHRHTMSSSTSFSPDIRPRFSSTLASSYSSPPSSTTARDPEPDSDSDSEDQALPPKRPDPIELLSRSPSSILNTSFDEDLPITINSAQNESCAHLTTLTHSNQTLSPFTRDHEHFTARSSPFVISRIGTARGGGGGGFASLSSDNDASKPVKGKRKRLHRIGAAKLPLPVLVATKSVPGTPRRTSDYSLSDRGSDYSDYFPMR